MIFFSMGKILDWHGVLGRYDHRVSSADFRGADMWQDAGLRSGGTECRHMNECLGAKYLTELKSDTSDECSRGEWARWFLHSRYLIRHSLLNRSRL